MIKFNPTTPIKFYVKESAYTKGEGASAEWHPITTNTNTFYSEWRGTFGDRLTAAQAIGVSDSATIRTFYNPAIYNALQTKQVLIIKNADSTAVVNGTLDRNNVNVYELWGGVDNIAEENQFMEFQVRRYQGK